MREIKFRAWDTDSNVWIGNVKDWEARYLNDKDTDNILMQYTGLKDKNGVEIYEGDIVRVQYYNNYNAPKNIQHKQESIEEVRYDEEMVTFRFGNIFPFHLWNDTLKDIEIIGNIYENKDML